MTIAELRPIVQKTIDQTLMSFGEIWFVEHSAATAFAGRLICALSPQVENRMLVAAPHHKKTRDDLVEYTNGIPLLLELREWMIDFVIQIRSPETFHRPLIACESEAWEKYGVGYGFEWKIGRQPKHGFVWDFRKLLFFQAPHLIFVGRFKYSENRLSQLKNSLSRCAREYAEFWSGRTISIVLLPSCEDKAQDEDFQKGLRQKTTIGVSSDSTELSFELLDLAAN